MAKSKINSNLPESPDNTAANSVANGFFQDPYGQADVGQEDDGSITLEDLTAHIETVHELNAKAQAHAKLSEWFDNVHPEDLKLF